MSHFYADRHIDRLRTSVTYVKRSVLGEFVRLDAVCAVTHEPVPFAERLALDYRPIAEGGHWGDAWDCGWFHFTGKVPESWRGPVVLRLEFGGEACVFDADGCPVYGLTNGSVFDADYAKDLYPIFRDAKGGETIDLWVETGANGLFGINVPGDPAWVEDKSKRHGTFDGTLHAARAYTFDYARWQLWFDFVIALDLVEALPEGTARRMQALRIASDAQTALATRGVEAARAEMQRLYALAPDPAAPDVYAIGHAHIDTGWLWPVRETMRKVARTFASQIHNIEAYPGYKFGASQAQLYDFAKRRYPALYAKVKKAIADGSWEVQGGMWVEADCNIPSGESLVRQFLVGKNFFRDEFGVDVQNLWLPDVFGYSGNLPQILRRAGMGYFLTQKLSWNIYNKFPHNTFWWRGIDGSTVLAHFPPEDDYNSRLVPSRLRRHETNNSEAGLVQEAISLFGIGDGGGGPSESYIERGLRCQHLNGCPPVHFSFAQTALEKMAAYGDKLDTWDGELYFELHRGTFTTQAAMKLWNRRGEEAFRAAEMLCAMAAFATEGSEGGAPRPFAYPAEEMLDLWKRFLINQFHDIIPGSSIHRIYEEQVPRVQAVVKRLKELQRAAAESLLAADPDALTLFNPTSQPFSGAVALPEGWHAACGADGATLCAQRDPDGVTRCGVEVPPLSFVTLRRAEKISHAEFAESAEASPLQKPHAEFAEGAEASPLQKPHAEGAEAPSVSSPTGSVLSRPAQARPVLENARVRYVFDPATMQMTECLDKETGRRLVSAAEPANRLELFEDTPHCYDAWDVEEYALDMRTDTAVIESVEPMGGPVRSGLLVKGRIGRSPFTQRVWLEAGSKRLDFETEIDWHEDHRLFRVAFPVAVESQEARYEIQYGTVARPTNDNTKWQHAQFECLGQRFADLSEHDFGAALLNNCKYGYRVKGHELSLSLLRAAVHPDPDADRGVNRFTYAFLPHAGDLASSDVLAHATALNQGVERFEGLAAVSDSKRTTARTAPLPVSVSGPVEFAVLKRAEKEDALVVRLVEQRGVRCEARVTVAPGAGRLIETNLMEWDDLGEVDTSNPLEFAPFAMRTFKLVR